MSHVPVRNDSNDAQALADLLRANRFPSAYDYPEQMRGTRDLLRRRHSFVRRRAGTYTHLQITLNSSGFTQPFRDAVRRKGDRRTLEKLPRNKDVGKNIACDLDYIKSPSQCTICLSMKWSLTNISFLE